MRIKSAFDESGIGIPFPIRALDVRQQNGERMDKALATLANAQSSPSSTG